MLAGRFPGICGTTPAANSLVLAVHWILPVALSRSARVHDVVATDSDRVTDALILRDSESNAMVTDFTVNTGKDSVAAMAACSTIPVVVTTDAPLALLTGSDDFCSTRVLTGVSMTTV